MMQDICLHQENLSVIEGMASRLNVTDNKVTGVTLKDGTVMNAKIVIVTTGTYMAGVNMIHQKLYQVVLILNQQPGTYQSLYEI